MKRFYLGTFLLLFSIVASAQDSFLELAVHQEFRGESQINLNRLLDEQVGRSDDLTIKGIILEAKSRQGQAEAAFSFRGSLQATQNIPGNPRQYESFDPRSFSQLNLSMPRVSTRLGSIDIMLRGNVKVARVILVLEELKRPPYPPTFQMVGELRADKVIDTTKTFMVNLPNVKVVKIKTMNNMIEIKDVYLNLFDGRIIRLDNLSGTMLKNRENSYTLEGHRGERVQSISIRATSPNPFGSRGELSLEVGTI